MLTHSHRKNEMEPAWYHCLCQLMSPCVRYLIWSTCRGLEMDCLAVLSGQSGVRSVQLDGEKVVTSANDRTVQLSIFHLDAP